MDPRPDDEKMNLNTYWGCIRRLLDSAMKCLIIQTVFTFDRFVLIMFLRFFHQCWMVVTVFLFTVAPLWAAEEEAEVTQEWVISYAIMILFLALTILILLRPLKRSDSAFSYDELQAQKEEEMKKLKGTH